MDCTSINLATIVAIITITCKIIAQDESAVIIDVMASS